MFNACLVKDKPKMQKGIRVKWIRVVFEQSSCQLLLGKKEKNILWLHYFHHFIQHLWPCFSNISLNLHLFLSLSLIDWKICTNAGFLLCRGRELQSTYIILSAENHYLRQKRSFRNKLLYLQCAELMVGSLNTSWYWIALILHETAFVFRAFYPFNPERTFCVRDVGNASFCACLCHLTISWQIL